MARGQGKKESKDVLIKSAELIGGALGGLEREIATTRDRLATLNAEATRLRAKLGHKGPARAQAQTQEDAAGHASRKQRRRQLSPEARKRISDLMKKRWAERRKAEG